MLVSHPSLLCIGSNVSVLALWRFGGLTPRSVKLITQPFGVFLVTSFYLLPIFCVLVSLVAPVSCLLVPSHLSGVPSN
jgi:hypothetical protein